MSLPAAPTHARVRVSNTACTQLYEKATLHLKRGIQQNVASILGMGHCHCHYKLGESPVPYATIVRDDYYYLHARVLNDCHCMHALARAGYHCMHAPARVVTTSSCAPTRDEYHCMHTLARDESRCMHALARDGYHCMHARAPATAVQTHTRTRARLVPLHARSRTKRQRFILGVTLNNISRAFWAWDVATAITNWGNSHCHTLPSCAMTTITCTHLCPKTATACTHSHALATTVCMHSHATNATDHCPHARAGYRCTNARTVAR